MVLSHIIRTFKVQELQLFLLQVGLETVNQRYIPLQGLSDNRRGRVALSQGRERLLQASALQLGLRKLRGVKSRVTLMLLWLLHWLS
jgi:hypothetical protein